MNCGNFNNLLVNYHKYHCYFIFSVNRDMHKFFFKLKFVAIKIYIIYKKRVYICICICLFRSLYLNTFNTA